MLTPCREKYKYIVQSNVWFSWDSNVNCYYMRAYLVVLISCDCNEVSLRKYICPESAVREFQDVVGSHDVESWLVFVHGVQNRLRKTNTNFNATDFTRPTDFFTVQPQCILSSFKGLSSHLLLNALRS